MLSRLLVFACITVGVLARTLYHKANRNALKVVKVKDLAHPLSLLRQSEGKGICPDGTTCPIDEVCCTNSCCEQPYVNCGQEVRCLTDDGKMECERDGEVFPCTACPGGKTGCANEPFTRCPTDPDADYCLTEGGFISCGENSKFGVLCNETDGSCCIEPDRCCPDRDGCCTEEEGGIGTPEPLAPLLTSSPGVTPSSDTAPSQSPSPSPDSDGGSEPPPPSKSPRESPPPLPPSEENAACFPGDVKVELRGGLKKRISDVKTGEEVLVSGGKYSEIFMWTHKDGNYEGTNYVELHTGEEHSVSATVGHMVYVCKKMRKGCEREIIKIEEVQVGDGVWVVESGEERIVGVSRKERVKAKGLFNPHTVDGDIVVNGVISTCYTVTVEPRMAHSLLAPLRALHRMLWQTKQ